MGELADITAAPVIWKHDGKEFTISPLVPADLGRAEREFRKIPLEKAASKLDAWGSSLEEHERNKIIDEADALAELTGDMKTEEGRRLMFSITGATILLFLSLTKRHPELTLSEVKKMVTFENLDEVQGIIDEVSGMTPKPEDGVDLGKSPGGKTDPTPK